MGCGGFVLIVCSQFVPVAWKVFCDPLFPLSHGRVIIFLTGTASSREDPDGLALGSS